MKWRLFCKTLVSLFWYHLKLLNSWEYFNLIFQLSHYKISILCCFGRSGTKTHKTTGDRHFINSKAISYLYSISCCTDKVLDLVPNQRKVKSSLILSSSRSAPGPGHDHVQCHNKGLDSGQTLDLISKETEDHDNAMSVLELDS